MGIETGSYDAALHMAGIENYNVMLYTSVLPPEAVELSRLPAIHHGSVLEGIIAIQHTDKPGTRITAGVLLAKVYRKADDSYLGGFACESAGNDSPEEAACTRPYPLRFKRHQVGGTADVRVVYAAQRVLSSRALSRITHACD